MCNEWKFKDSKNTAVITNNDIISGNTTITYVFHDENDGIWQFLDNGVCSEENARIVSLKEITELDNSILSLYDLPRGYMAYRKTRQDKWRIKKA